MRRAVHFKFVPCHKGVTQIDGNGRSHFRPADKVKGLPVHRVAPDRSILGRMLSRRVSHGIGWGMVSAGMVAVVPIVTLAAGGWPAAAPVTPSFFARVLGLQPMGVPALMLSVLWQLIYGGFWGAFLTYVTSPVRPGEESLERPSMFAYGLGVGLYRTLVANLTVLLYIGWGAFGALVSPVVVLVILLSNLGFGVTLSWLVAREDAGRVVFRLPRVYPLGRSARRRS
jgi:hypothetical protein